MTKEEIAEILAKPYAQQLLNGPEPARMAYDGLDGEPRVIPIGFWTEEERVGMATVPKSAKVAALRKNPKVALTIDQGAFPPKALLIRGHAEVELVEGIPDGYLTAGRKVMTDEQYPDWLAGVQGLYEEMVLITITPTWAKLLDFETTIPKAVEDLIKEKGGRLTTYSVRPHAPNAGHARMVDQPVIDGQHLLVARGHASSADRVDRPRERWGGR